jgi:RNA polymerase sigma-70 factor (ECF subfamily)
MRANPSDGTSPLAAGGINPLTEVETVRAKSSAPPSETTKIIDVREGFIKFYDAEYYPVVRFVMRRGASLQRAEEAVQEAFSQAWEHYVLPGTWEQAIANPRAWIRTVAFNCYRRPPGRRTRPEIVLVPEFPDLPDETDSFADLSLETLSVLDALRSLDPELRAVMAFRLDGFTAVEIGGQLGIDPQKVRDRLKKARKILARKLGSAKDQEGRVR